MEKKNFIFSNTEAKFVRVKAKTFSYEGFTFHIRKDYEYACSSTKKWMITETTSGCTFAIGETLLEAQICMDLMLCVYSKKQIQSRIDKGKAKSYDKMVVDFLIKTTK